MRKRPFITLVFVIVACYSSFAQQSLPAPSNELNTLLMHATFRISGAGNVDSHKTSFGTVFVMGIPLKSNPAISNAVLVTAAHVLEDIAGDKATLVVRRKNAEGTYSAFPYELAIRKMGAPLYVKHKSADVAAMYVSLPIEVPISGLPPDFLVTDKLLEDIEVHPGDEAFCLGFPLAASTPGGFPILRSGRIASYPLTPMKETQVIWFDVFGYGGVSGGPVYFSYTNRYFKGQAHIGGLAQGILGLLIQERNSSLPEYAGKSLNLFVVVPALFIRETINMLPPTGE